MRALWVLLFVLAVPLAAHAQPVSCQRVTYNIISLDIATVTTGGTAVNALSAGHAVCGGFVVTSNSAGICVNQKGTAGTATLGDTACVAANVPYYLAPTANAISVNSTSSSVSLGGNGYQ